jgi:hypothetical protein
MWCIQTDKMLLSNFKDVMQSQVPSLLVLEGLNSLLSDGSTHALQFKSLLTACLREPKVCVCRLLFAFAFISFIFFFVKSLLGFVLVQF